VASNVVRYRSALKHLAHQGFDRYKHPVAATVRWMVGLVLLGEESAPAVDAFRLQRDRERPLSDHWMAVIEDAARAAGNELIGEPAQTFAERALERLAQHRKSPIFANAAVTLEAAMGLSAILKDRTFFEDTRLLYLKSPMNDAVAVESFEFLYLSSSRCEKDPVEANGWDGYRITSEIMDGASPEVIGFPVCLLARVAERTGGVIPLLKGRLPEDDRRTHLVGDSYGPRLLYTGDRIEVQKGADGLLVRIRVEVEGQDRFDGAYEFCAPLTAALQRTVTTLGRGASATVKKLLKTALSSDDACIEAELSFQGNEHAEVSNLDVLTNRFAVAVEHAQHVLGWRAKAGAVRAATK